MNRSDVRRMRLAAQHLSTPATDVRAVTRDLLALQAQDFAQALWAVAVRTRGATRTDVLAALADGSVVRTLPMRGTLHFLAAEDLRWMLDLTAARTLQSAATRFANLGIDDDTIGRAADLVGQHLAGGGRIGRADFLELLERNGISCEGQRGYHLIFALTQRQLVCWGPPEGTQQSLVLVEDWIPSQPGRDRDDALREFAVRYFRGHGPASIRDFAWWSKLTLADARTGLAGARRELTELELDGEQLWAAPDAAEAPPASRSVLALPGFDEYLLGYRERGLVVDGEHFDRIVPGSNGIFLPIIVADGRVVGTWRRTARSTIAAVEPEYFDEAGITRRTLFEREARRYSRFALG